MIIQGKTAEARRDPLPTDFRRHFSDENGIVTQEGLHFLFVYFADVPGHPLEQPSTPMSSPRESPSGVAEGDQSFYCRSLISAIVLVNGYPGKIPKTIYTTKGLPTRWEIRVKVPYAATHLSLPAFRGRLGSGLRRNPANPDPLAQPWLTELKGVIVIPPGMSINDHLKKIGEKPMVAFYMKQQS